MTKKPIVTVYIPTKNRNSLCQRAVQSIADQTFSSIIECIIIDDGSTDPFLLAETSVASRLHSFRIFRNPLSLGASNARNIAINNANGIFITGCDDDDTFDINRIENFLDYWYNKKSKNTFILHSDVKLISRNSINTITYPQRVHIDQIRKSNCIGNQVFTLTTILQSILFDENIFVWEDWHLWINLIDQFGSSENIGIKSYNMDVSHSNPRVTTHSSHESIDKTLVYINSIKDRKIVWNTRYFYAKLQYFFITISKENARDRSLLPLFEKGNILYFLKGLLSITLSFK